MAVVEAVAAALVGEDAGLVIADEHGSPADVIAELRGEAEHDAVVLLLLPALSAIDRAMLLAALGPLAAELAPRRIGAVDIAAGASIAPIVAAARHLAAARSTTGQCLRVT